MSKQKNLGFILLSIALIGLGYYAGNKIIKSKIEQDFVALYALLPPEESVHDYVVVPVDGYCDGNTFKLNRGGFSIIEYDKDLGGFTLSTYRPTQIRAVASGCMDMTDIIQVCRYELDGLINRPFPMDYGYHSTHEEHLLHSHRVEGLYDKLNGLSSLQTEFHQVKLDGLMTGFPVTLRNQARYNGQTIQVVSEGQKTIRYGVSALQGKVDNFELGYRLAGMVVGALLGSTLFLYAAKK